MKRPRLGLEVTSSCLRLAVIAGAGANAVALVTRTKELPAGMIISQYAAPNVQDPDGFAALLRDCLADAGYIAIRRAALSLPDSVFRVQTLEFDELPVKTADRDKLVRWRLEKAAAFDIADTVLRYQVLKRQDSGFTVLACAAKQGVIRQYESALTGAGLEPWSVGPSSFHILQRYFNFIADKTSATAAFAFISDDSLAMIVMEGGAVRFYRFKEIKKGGAEDAQARLMREIEDSLHFYTHLDRSQETRINRLFLGGDTAELLGPLAEGLRSATSLEIEALSLVGGTPMVFAAALGAGGAL